jgi:hypothetical protein
VAELEKNEGRSKDFAMGDASNKVTADGASSSASARVICEEFLKVLSRKEVEQPMIWYVYAPRWLLSEGLQLQDSNHPRNLIEDTQHD